VLRELSQCRDMATGLMTRVQFPAGAVWVFPSLCHHVDIGSVVHPASCAVGVGVSFPDGKVAGA
jgi:hypothetical protein